MMRISKAEDQALRLCMRLAKNKTQVNLAQLAEQEFMPEPTAAKLLSLLRRGGVVAASRGRNGGYALAAPATDISVAAVLTAVTDPVPPHHCLQPETVAGDCSRLNDCGLRSVWRHLQVQIQRLLEGTSLADLLHTEVAVDRKMAQLWPLGAADSSRRGPDAETTLSHSKETN